MSKIQLNEQDIISVVTECVVKTLIESGDEEVKNLIREKANESKVLAKDVMSICESSWSRVIRWMEAHDICTITAFRNRLIDVTDNTFIPEGMEVGQEFTLQDNRMKNRIMKAKLLSFGYGVTKIYGSWIEGISGTNPKEVAEESFFVVNLKDDPSFYNNLFKLSEYFNQDSFLYKPKGSDTAVLVGTNASDFPGYGEKVDAGQLTSLPSKFMSRIKNAAFAFVDKANWVVKDKKSDLTQGDLEDYESSYSWRQDDKPTFDARKQQRVSDSELQKTRLAEDWLVMYNNNGIVLDEMKRYTEKQRDVIGKIAGICEI